MIFYWAWPPDGAGHAVRAAAICRHLRNDVLVLRGTDNPKINKSLDHFGIPYVVFERRAEAEKYVLDNHRGDFIVFDDYPTTRVINHADLYIWRVNRPQRPSRPIPTLRMEGPGALWPILMLEEDEILSRGEARDALGLDPDAFTIIGVTSTARPGVVEATNPDFMLDPEQHWPALKYLRAADHIVGCPGANLFGEAAYLDIPVTWVRAPHAPDQVVRLQSAVGEPQANVARRFAEIIDSMAG